MVGMPWVPDAVYLCAPPAALKVPLAPLPLVAPSLQLAL